MNNKPVNIISPENFAPISEMLAPKSSNTLSAIIAGACSGIVASIAIIFFWYHTPSAPPVYPAVKNTDDTSVVMPIIEPLKAPESDAVSKAQKTIVTFYRNSKNNILTPDDRIAIGVAVTSDGWVAVPEETFTQAPKDLVAVTRTSEATVGQKITDPFSHITFVKINRTDLQVVPFANTVLIGSPITQFDRTGMLSFGFLTSARHHLATAPTSSEALDLTVTTTNDENPGSILFAPDGSLLGIVGKKGIVTPGSVVAEATKLLLKNNSFARSKLGVIALDLSALIIRNKQLPRDGALLVKKGTTPAVQKKSIADMSGIKEGDVITKIDSIDINADHTLAEALSLYAPGTTVTIAVWRNGAIRQITVVLP